MAIMITEKTDLARNNAGFPANLSKLEGDK
jgi:hypothetical protein